MFEMLFTNIAAIKLRSLIFRDGFVITVKRSNSIKGKAIDMHKQ